MNTLDPTETIWLPEHKAGVRYKVNARTGEVLSEAGRQDIGSRFAPRLDSELRGSWDALAWRIETAPPINRHVASIRRAWAEQDKYGHWQACIETIDGTGAAYRADSKAAAWAEAHRLVKAAKRMRRRIGIPEPRTNESE